MKKFVKIALIALFMILLFWAIGYIISSNSKEKELFSTEAIQLGEIEKKAVATGKIVPEEEIEIKPNISGIVEKIHVEEGQNVSVGQLIATVRVVPRVAEVNTAIQNINALQIDVNNQKRQFERQKELFREGVISKQDYENAETAYLTSLQNLKAAQKNLEITKTGVTGGLENLATNYIRATANGILLELPIKEGDQVIEANSFNPGTTIAKIADTQKMIFEGKVDEAEAGKLREGMDATITIGALQDVKIKGVLSFIAPKGTEESGTVQYKVKVKITDYGNSKIRAGYSANAEIILEKKKNILKINEAYIQFDEKNSPFVEVKQPDGSFKKVFITTGLSDGIYSEVTSGLKKGDLVKVINPAEIEKKRF